MTDAGGGGRPAGTRGYVRRAGFSAAETLVALLLGLFVAHLGLSTLARLRSAEARLASRTDGLVAMRMARHVLRRELRHGEHGSDWWVDGDSLSLRAFRGTGLVCPRDTAAVELPVVFEGDRRPDPTKDSVVLVDALGRSQVRALVSVSTAGSPCLALDTTAVVERWGLDAPAGPGIVVARLFERGSYHLSGAALRYRRGASGRQPLTPEVWSGDTGWTRSGPWLGLAAAHRDSTAGPPWEAFIARVGSP